MKEGEFFSLVTPTFSNFNDCICSSNGGPINGTTRELLKNIPLTLNTPLTGSELVLCAPVGIEETSINSLEIEIYPNPLTEKIKVSGFRFKADGKNQIIIYDIMGEKVFEQQLPSGKTEEELNLSFLQQGVYFLNVKSNGVGYTQKIMKM